MQGLKQLLPLERGAVCAVVGCGGKTSLIELLAREHADEKVLITPTTKIYRPEGNAPVVLGRQPCLAHVPCAGVQYLGSWDEGRGKLCALPAADWPQLVRGYDLVLMEGDGSRGLPCKGWTQTEPVIAAFATHTLGVITTRALGQRADEATVLRPEQFARLTGIAPGHTITLRALADMVGKPEGMFKGRRGKAVLLINQAEDAPALERAAELATMVKERYPGVVSLILCGSVRQNRWMAL